MKTSYKYNRTTSKKEESIDVSSDIKYSEGSEEVKENLRNAYIDFTEQKDILNSAESVNESLDESSSVSSDEDDIAMGGDEFDDGVDGKKKKSKSLVENIIGILVLLCILVAYILISQKLNKASENSDIVLASINRLYTTKEKVDIKAGITQTELDALYMELIEASKKGENTKYLEEELDTIGYFLSDKSTLLQYDDNSYDLTTVGMVGGIEAVIRNTTSYTVSGLAVTINDLANKIEGDYNSFIALRSELQGIADVLTFDPEKYKSKISEVSHAPNRSELNSIYSKLIADKSTAEAERKLAEAESDEARVAAQQALEEAKRVQEQMQKDLEATRKELEKAAEEAAKKSKEEKESGKQPTAEPTKEVKKEETPDIINEEDASTNEDPGVDDNSLIEPME